MPKEQAITNGRGSHWTLFWIIVWAMAVTKTSVCCCHGFVVKSLTTVVRPPSINKPGMGTVTISSLSRTNRLQVLSGGKCNQRSLTALLSSSSMEHDDDEQESFLSTKKGTIGREVKKFLSDFRYGAMFVHNNNLALQWEYIYKTTLVLFPIVGVLTWLPWQFGGMNRALSIEKCLYNFFSTCATYFGFSRYYRKLFQAVPLPSIVHIWIICPIVEELIFRLVFFNVWKTAAHQSRAFSRGWKMFRKIQKDKKKDFNNIITWANAGKPADLDTPDGDFAILDQEYPKMKGQSLDDWAWGLQRKLEWDRLRQSTYLEKPVVIPNELGPSNEAASVITTSPEKRLWFGHAPCALVSSILFALYHLGNHFLYDGSAIPQYLKTNSELREVLERWRSLLISSAVEKLTIEQLFSYFVTYVSIFYSCLQTIVTFKISLNVMTPLYCDKGLGAAIGSHASWNLFVSLSENVLVRLLGRLWRRLTSKKSRKNKKFEK